MSFEKIDYEDDDFDITDLDISNELSCPTSWNEFPKFYKRYMGFTGIKSGVFLQSEDKDCMRVIRMELCAIPDETTITLVLDDESSKVPLGRQNLNLFRKLKRLKKATIAVFVGANLVDEYVVPVISEPRSRGKKPR